MPSFRNIENRHAVYRDKHYMKKFYEFLREYAMMIISSKKKKNIIEKRREGIIWNGKIHYICKEKFENKYVKDEKYRKVRDSCHYTGKYKGDVHSIYNLK